MSNPRIRNYFFQAGQDLEQGQRLREAYIDMSNIPLYSAKHHGYAFAYPFVQITHVVKNLARLAKGIFLLMHATCVNPRVSVPMILRGMLAELGALAFNALNLVVSLITLFTRTVSTALNTGYSASTINFDFSRLDHMISDRNSYQGMSLEDDPSGVLNKLDDDAMERACVW